jgi:nitrate reductase NapE component
MSVVASSAHGPSMRTKSSLKTFINCIFRIWLCLSSALLGLLHGPPAYNFTPSNVGLSLQSRVLPATFLYSLSRMKLTGELQPIHTPLLHSWAYRLPLLPAH